MILNYIPFTCILHQWDIETGVRQVHPRPHRPRLHRAAQRNQSINRRSNMVKGSTRTKSMFMTHLLVANTYVLSVSLYITYPIPNSPTVACLLFFVFLSLLSLFRQQHTNTLFPLPSLSTRCYLTNAIDWVK